MALPTGYTEIPYLESTGKQYISLRFSLSYNQSVELDADMLADGLGTNQIKKIFGIMDYDSPGYYNIGVYRGTGSAMSRLEYGGVSYNISNPYHTGRHIYKAEYDSSAGTMSFLIDGEPVGFRAANQFTASINPILFGYRYLNSGSSSTGVALFSGIIYEFKLYNSDGSLARDMVPARRNSDSALGMFDITGNAFYTNAGSGSFVTKTIDGPETITVSSEIAVGKPVSITWSASPAVGVTGYELERSVNGRAFGSIYSGTGYFYSDTAASGWTSVQYRVRAVTADDVSPWVSSGSLPVVDPSAPTTPNFAEEYQAYLAGLEKPFKKIVRLEFLQPDDTVAFALGGVGQKVPVSGRDTRTFLQSGSVSVSLANGSRRKASVMLGNRDGAFDYAVNKLWFGQRVRLLMGMRLPNGEDFYFPMGVFYIENPSVLFSPAEKTATLNLTDKWAYLDGTLFGNLEAAYSVSSGTNIFSAIDSLIHMDRFTQGTTTDVQRMVDPATAVYTTYFNGKTYLASRSDGSISANIAMTDAPYTITENRGSTMGALILKLNEMLAGWIGYDGAGALRLEPSQDDIDDADKPVLFAFTPENSVLLSHSSVSQNTAVYNDVTIAGQGLTNAAVWARAINADPASDTNVNLIGRRVFVEEKSDYWNTDQCAALARWTLKRKTVLQKSVTIECGQMFHLIENRLVSVKRVDKPGSPVEKHLIQGFTIPIGETGSMSITATSVTDIPDFTITTSVSS